MMGPGLADQVAHTLSGQGPLADHWPHFKPRAGQLEMALAVTEALEQGGSLVVEAGTGVGKTFAYLVPVLLSGQRALISTATKALQDQLFSRDLPRLTQVLGLPLRVAMLKGRSSYLCLHRMAQARQQPQADQGVWQAALARVERWAQTTRSGDMAELSGLDESSRLWPWVTSTRENCLGTHCPQYKACHVNLARKEALAADVVVINHHLFFADLAVRESGVAELLPTVGVTVFDEAHQLNEIGVQFLGQSVSTLQLFELARDALGAGLTLARGLVDWNALAHGLELAARDWRLVAGAVRTPVRLRWVQPAPQGLESVDWLAALQEVGQALQAMAQALEQVQELAPDFARLLERCENLKTLTQQFAEPAAPDRVRWLEVSSALRAVQAPLDVAQTFMQLTQSPKAPAIALAGVEQAVSQPSATSAWPAKAWVFTSATLGDDHPALRWFTEPCGLTHARALRVDSPFDYAQQAALYVPQHLAAPGQAQHGMDVANLAWAAARRLGGRTMVLTTTTSALRSIAAHLQSQLDSTVGVDLQVLVQGHSPKRLLLERFRQGAEADQPGCILVATASFWEGVDVPGQALQLVIIDKLPFAPPDDPVMEARGARLQQQGGHVFMDLSLPQAAVALKQGAGRLIRSESDCGVLVVCDNRLSTKGYGRRLLDALPPMRHLKDEQAFWQTLDALAAEKGGC